MRPLNFGFLAHALRLSCTNADMFNSEPRKQQTHPVDIPETESRLQRQTIFAASYQSTIPKTCLQEISRNVVTSRRSQTPP